MLATLFLSITVAIIATLQSLTFTRCYSLNCGHTSDTMEDIMPLPFFNSVPVFTGTPHSGVPLRGAPLCGVPPGGAPRHSVEFPGDISFLPRVTVGNNARR